MVTTHHSIRGDTIDMNYIDNDGDHVEYKPTTPIERIFWLAVLMIVIIPLASGITISTAIEACN